MSQRYSNRIYYINHSNPHKIPYKTFLRRMHTYKRQRSVAMSTPYMWKWWDRKTQKFHSLKSNIVFISIDSNAKKETGEAK